MRIGSYILGITVAAPEPLSKRTAWVRDCPGGLADSHCHRLPWGVDENSPLLQAIVAIRLLLSSWAGMEEKTESNDEQIRIQDTAMNRGGQVAKFINKLGVKDGLV